MVSQLRGIAASYLPSHRQPGAPSLILCEHLQGRQNTYMDRKKTARHLAFSYYQHRPARSKAPKRNLHTLLPIYDYQYNPLSNIVGGSGDIGEAEYS